MSNGGHNGGNNYENTKRTESHIKNEAVNNYNNKRETVSHGGYS